MDYYVNREIGRQGLKDAMKNGMSGTAPISSFPARAAMKISVFAPSAAEPLQSLR